MVKRQIFRSVGNVTAGTIAHYIRESQGKAVTEVRFFKSMASGQRRLDDF
jgi:putative transposase